MGDIKLNPWLSIWVRPRQTILKIVDKYQEKYLYLLTFFALIILSINEENINNIRSLNFNIYFVGLLILIIYLMVLALIYIEADLLAWTGHLIGGKGKRIEIRAVIIWSLIPNIYLGIVKFVFFLFNLLFVNLSNEFIDMVQMLLSWIEGIIEIWSLVIFINCLSAIQKLPTWKTILNAIIPFILVIGCFFGIATLKKGL